ncbi:holo-ACP synthase [Leifsonia poae]|uniref:Holo-[acyl-carrier-protein] synthase n=1 Tax=Leifsonia poae TaxID=110933 RepID=A0A9W6H7T4_9MICO|nr:holo-ACP synthase [Leifsonia poae]GLJ75009.1 holo-[acyl-carrier-protein] synthase [Leifsonia poae]
MIAGIGVDVVDLQRFTRAIERTPRLRERLFTDSERSLPVHSLAARFAAKEALIKALGDSEGVRWHDMEIVPDEERNPGFVLHNVVEGVVRDRGITSIHVSMTHDAGIAMAFVVTEIDGGAGRG